MWRHEARTCWRTPNRRVLEFDERLLLVWLAEVACVLEYRSVDVVVIVELERFCTINKNQSKVTTDIHMNGRRQAHMQLARAYLEGMRRAVTLGVSQKVAFSAQARVRRQAVSDKPDQ